MKETTELRSLELAAKSWRPGTKMQTIIVDGWSRGFHKSQTLHECIQAGYSKCIAEPAIDQRWAMMDEEIKALEEHEKEAGTSADTHWLGKELKEMADAEPTAIRRYEDYWAKDLTRAHHELDCPNPTCDKVLKINRPPKRGGEVWDSLAECPYCNGTFFYESRYLRVDAAFKGFF